MKKVKSRSRDNTNVPINSSLLFHVTTFFSFINILFINISARAPATGEVFQLRKKPNLTTCLDFPAFAKIERGKSKFIYKGDDYFRVEKKKTIPNKSNKQICCIALFFSAPHFCRYFYNIACVCPI